MIIEVAFGLATVTAVAVLFWQAWWTMPPSCAYEPEVAVTAPVVPPPAPRDILADYARELNFSALTPEGSAEHRLELLEALLREAEHETLRTEILVDKLGQHLLRGSVAA